ncbi:MAG TPA: GNAT family N-acetyltransferase [Candidatus Limnocylindrales bacterium]|nr:GNAT family N-acetyltransferase [Candidatus Limnocylindrales bacterium]
MDPSPRSESVATAAPGRSSAPPQTGPPAGLRDLTRADVRWLAWHEAGAHALTGREVRDLGDAWMLYDETDREPFWNRIAGIAWPSDPHAFDRRLTEILALFAGLDRIPHVWPSPGYDEPADLTERLLAHGFVDHGGGMLLLLDPDRGPGPIPPLPAGVTIERVHRRTGAEAIAAAEAMAAVLVTSFAVEPERRVAIELEAVQGLTTDAYHAVIVRVDGQPAAVARRTTFAGASYLSSIGTDPAFRGRGLGRLVTAIAAADALAAGSRWTYLGVFEDNTVARRLYADLGFDPVGVVGPDLLLRP